jgi:streptogramin lyase
MRFLLAATLTFGLTLSAGVAAAAPGARLKQFRVPTANSEPRAITNGSDGNRWFTEGTSFTNAPPKVARITPAGLVTEFPADAAAGCNGCIISDIEQGPANTLYVTSNDATLMRFNVATATFGTPVQMPKSNALAGDLAIHGDDIWITDFNNDVVWRYRISTGQFTSVPASDPAAVAVDAAGNAWFTEPFDINSPTGSGDIGRIDAVSGAVTRTSTTLIPRFITVATDGQVWFSSRFSSPHAVGRLNPANNSITEFPLVNNGGPEGIAASPDGTIWFTQEITGNVANINNAGAITEGKAVRGSQPFGITVAPNGDPWYTMFAADKIAILQL